MQPAEPYLHESVFVTDGIEYHNQTIMGLSADQLHKIRGDLTVTQTNMSIFSEMLSELTPGLEHPEDRSMFEQLHATCRAMQTRLVELIDQVEDDKLTADLLEVNDNMNNLFLR